MMGIVRFTDNEVERHPVVSDVLRIYQPVLEG